MAIEVKNLSKRLGKLQVLSDLSFSVPKGRITGFLGPNGAGKTTTLRILLGLLAKDSGTIKLLGEELETGPALSLKGKIGYLPQDPVFPEQLSAWEVLALVAENYQLPLAEKRARELLAQFQLEEAAQRRVVGFSRGMKQKLGLVAALLPQPQLLLLDEPVSALDPAGRHQVLELLAALGDKTTVFLSSHILADVQRICQRVIIINKGQKLVEEELETLLSRYREDCYSLRVDAKTQKLAQSILKADEAVAGLKAEGGSLVISIKPGQLQRFRTTTLLALLQSGVQVIEFTPAGEDLERIFFQILEEGELDAQNNSLGN